MKTKIYNGIEFLVMEGFEFGDTLVSCVKFASKDEAETALERALCEYVKDEPMTCEYWRVEAELESGEILAIILGDGEGVHTSWDCGGIEYRLDGESYYESEDTDNYEYYRMIGDIKDTLAKVAKLRDGQVERRFDEHWATIYAVKVMLYPEEFTEEEKKTVTRMLQLILHC